MRYREDVKRKIFHHGRSLPDEDGMASVEDEDEDEDGKWNHAVRRIFNRKSSSDATEKVSVATERLDLHHHHQRHGERIHTECHTDPYNKIVLDLCISLGSAWVSSSHKAS